MAPDSKCTKCSIGCCGFWFARFDKLCLTVFFPAAGCVSPSSFCGYNRCDGLSSSHMHMMCAVTQPCLVDNVHPVQSGWAVVTIKHMVIPVTPNLWQVITIPYITWLLIPLLSGITLWPQLEKKINISGSVFVIWPTDLWFCEWGYVRLISVVNLCSNCFMNRQGD